MRSGSTLLKALLSSNSDIADCPEVPFQLNELITYLANINGSKWLVIKKPATFYELNYPNIHDLSGSKVIILIRNPYDTVISLYNMAIENQSGSLDFRFLLRYWKTIYINLMEFYQIHSSQILLIRYENLIDDPVKETAAIFEFLGTKDTKGIRSYSLPKNYKWNWGSDDGGSVIKSLVVQTRESEWTNTSIIEYIKEDRIIQFLLNEYGYEEMLPFLIK